MTEELLPCPFCGEAPEHDSLEDEKYDATLWVKCISPNCEVHPSLFWYEDDRVGNGLFFDPDDMYDAWNTRANTPTVTADKAYTERMMVVRMLAKMSGCVYGVGKDDNEDWDDDWRNVVYIDLPQGQVSWHIAPHDMHLFEDFPQYEGKWNGLFSGRDPDFVKSVKPTPPVTKEEAKAAYDFAQAYDPAKGTHAQRAGWTAHFMDQHIKIIRAVLQAAANQ